MSATSDISVSAATAGELNERKPRWMPLEGNPEVNELYFYSIFLINFISGIKQIFEKLRCKK